VTSCDSCILLNYLISDVLFWLLSPYVMTPIHLGEVQEWESHQSGIWEF